MADVEDEAFLALKRDEVNQKFKESRDKVLKERENLYEQKHEQQIRAKAILEEALKIQSVLKSSLAEIEASPPSDPLCLTDQLDLFAKNLSIGEKHLSQHTSMIPIYEVRSMQGNLKEIGKQFQELQERLQPKKKFGFKGRKSKKTQAAESKEDVVTAQVSSIDLDKTGYTLSDRNSETICISEGEINAKDVMIRCLNNCTIRLTGNPSTLHMTELKGCTILSGPVTTSVFVEDCSSSTFVLACQQLRTHSTTKSDFYLHVTSKAIIEDCGEVRFAPRDGIFGYPTLLDHYVSSGLERQVNNWDRVDDFNWLANDKVSPHWSIIPEVERKKKL